MRTRRPRVAAEALETRALMSGDHVLTVERDGPPEPVLPGGYNHSPAWYLPAAGADSVGGTGALAGDGNPTWTTNAAGLPLLTSRADGRGLKIFLDFDGYNSDTPFSTDGDGSTFNASEQKNVYDTWRDIVSYFAMLDVNVTTIQPPTGGSNPNFVWHRISNSIQGGAAYVGWITNNSSNSWTGPEGGTDRRSAVAHEVGHQFGLSHQAEHDRNGNETTDYSDGWDDRNRPIMGVDFLQNVRTWFYGRNSDDAGNLVDELSNMANFVRGHVGSGDGYMPDDHGGLTSSATVLGGAGGTLAGTIERVADADVFRFTSVGGAYHIDATPTFESAASPKIELLDAAGNIVAARDDADQRNWNMNDQEFSLELPAGATYYVRVSGGGDYSEQGEYLLTAAPLAAGAAAGWASTDVGNTTIFRGGTAAFDPSTGVLTQIAGGTDIWNTSDQFRYSYTTLAGDGSITARVDYLQDTGFHGKAGVMIRHSLAANSAHVFMGLKPSGILDPIARTTSGGGSINAGSSVASTNRWVRVTRVGNTFTLATSANGTTWSTVGTQTISMAGPVYIGLATTAWNARAQAYSKFSNISLTGNLGAQPNVIDSRMMGWGLEVAQEIDRTLRLTTSTTPNLYAETANLNGTTSGGFNGRAFVWPASTQFRVLNMLAKNDPAAYTSVLRQFSDQLRARYWDVSGYRAGAGNGTSPSNVERFYDDNAHLVVALVEAYNVTRDPVYLTRALETQAFVMSGEDTRAGGGIYFKQSPSDDSKNTISTLQGARGAALLYRATGDVKHLNDAKRLLGWAQSHVQMSNGLFWQGYSISGNAPGGVDIVNGAGTGVSAFLAVYNASGETAYLDEARRIANASVGRFVNSSNGSMGDEGFWAFELIDAYVDLAQVENKAYWQGRANTALVYLHDNMRDVNGHYDTFWGRGGPITGTTLTSWDLNEMAPVARAYLYTALNQTAAPATGLTPPAITTITPASGASTGINLSWSASAGATGYVVARSVDGVTYGDVATLGAATLSYADNGLFGSMRYFYRVSALNGSLRSAPSAAASVVNKPNAPTIPNGSYALPYVTPSTSRIYLNWTDTQGDAGYRVERSSNGGSTYTQIATTPTNASGYNDITGLAANTAYTYRITPITSVGDGVAPSLVINATTRMDAPVNFRFTAVNATSVSLAWNDAAGETGYRLERSSDRNTWATVATPAANVTAANDGGLTPLTKYYYRLVALNGAVESVPSVIFAATPGTTALPSPWSTTDVGAVGGRGAAGFAGDTWTVIGTGQDIWATTDQFHYANRPVVGDGSITVRIGSFDGTEGWSKSGVMFRESTATNSRFAMVTFNQNGNVQFNYRTATGANAGQFTSVPDKSVPVWLRLARSGNNFTGSWSPDGVTWSVIGTQAIAMPASATMGMAVNSANGTTLTKTTFTNVTAVATPLAPAGLTATGGDASVTLGWTASAEATSYRVKRATTPGGPYAAIATVTTPGYVDEAVTNGTRYYYVVSALNGGLESANSAEAAATPQSAAPPWLAPGSVATWNASTKVLTVTGAAGIIADPGADAPIITASGAAAVVSFNTPAGGQVNLGGVQLSNNASANVSATGAARVLVVATGANLTLDATATLDLTDNALVVRHATQSAASAGHSAINGLARTAFNDFGWNGKGITSSTAATDVANGLPSTLGILLNNDGDGGPLFYGAGTDSPTFMGAAADANTVMVRFTRLGDGDLNGTADSVDFALFQAGYTAAAPYVGFAFGDYDYNGAIDSVDFGLFQAGYQAAGSASPVVEEDEETRLAVVGNGPAN